MSTPSFIDRLRSRSRRPEQISLLVAAPLPVVETSPGPLPERSVIAELPEDHWHAGDPRLVASAVGDVPSPRRPVDRRGLHLVPDVDLRGEVVDLRAAAEHGPGPSAGQPAAPLVAPVAPAREAPCSEPSTWLG